MTTERAGASPVECRVRPGVRYVLCPGMVTSQSDGQQHYIGPMALARLYGVRLDECEIYEPAPQWTETAFRQAQARTLGLIRLAPRYDGDYSLPGAGPNVRAKLPAEAALPCGAKEN